MKKRDEWWEIKEKEREKRKNRTNVIIKGVKLENKEKVIELLEEKLGIEEIKIEEIWKFKNKFMKLENRKMTNEIIRNKMKLKEVRYI